MIKVQIQGFDEVRRSLDKLSAQLQDKAAVMAINKVAQKTATKINREIRNVFGISAEAVRESISIMPARNAAGGVKAEVVIFGSRSKRGRSMNVIPFLEKSITMAEARRRNKAGTLAVRSKLTGKLVPILGFKFKIAGGVKRIEGAFIGNKGRTVFVRTGDKRLPIKPVQMIGVSGMFKSGSVRMKVMDNLEIELPIEVERAVALLMRRLEL